MLPNQRKRRLIDFIFLYTYNINMDKPNVTKRARCPRGTRWVASAQKCMPTAETTRKSRKQKISPPPKEEEQKSESKEEEEQKIESKEEHKEEEQKPPENILLRENQKKCPPHYVRHPPKSRNCRLTTSLKDMETKRKTRKNTFVPRILSKEDEQIATHAIEQSLDIDVSIH